MRSISIQNVMHIDEYNSDILYLATKLYTRIMNDRIIDEKHFQSDA